MYLACFSYLVNRHVSWSTAIQVVIGLTPNRKSLNRLFFLLFIYLLVNLFSLDLNKLILVTIPLFQEMTDVGRYSPALEANDLYNGASKCFQQAKIYLESIQSPSNEVHFHVSVTSFRHGCVIRYVYVQTEHVGHGGSVVGSVPCVQKVAGSNSTPAIS